MIRLCACSDLTRVERDGNFGEGFNFDLLVFPRLFVS